MKSVVLVIVTAAVLAVGGVLLVAGESTPTNTASSAADDDARDADTEPDSTTSTSTTSTSTTTTEPDVSRIVPNAIGLDRAAARASVRGAGLMFDVDVEAATTFEQIGTVIDQVPAPGSDTVVGETVEVVVAERPSPVTVDATTNIRDVVDFWDVDDTEPGGCYNGRPSGGGLVLDRVECIEPHDVQLVGIVEIDVSGAFDEERIDGQLAIQCSFVHEVFVGAPHEQSRLATFTIRPHPDFWAIGERQGHCFVLAPSRGQRLVGTAEMSLW